MWDLKYGHAVRKRGKSHWVGKARNNLDPEKRGGGFLIKEHLFVVVAVVVVNRSSRGAYRETDLFPYM